MTHVTPPSAGVKLAIKLTAAVSQGLLTPEEATSLSAMLKDHASVLSETEVERRLLALERAASKDAD